MGKRKTLIRLQDRYPTVSTATRARWIKDPLMPPPDLIAGDVSYFSTEKLETYERLRMARELARRAARPKPIAPPLRRPRGPRKRAEGIEQTSA